MTAPTLYKKISQVMAKSKRIPKNGYNDFHKYAYATEADVVEHIREIMAEVGLAHTFNVAEVQRDEIEGKEGKVNFMTRVWCEFTLWDADTGESVVSRVCGESLDSGDKGIYKSMTGADKYFLMKTFLIPTGDDPEQVGAGDAGAGSTKRTTTSKPSAAPSPPIPDSGLSISSAPQTSRQNPDSKPTEKQIKRMFALINAAGLTKEDVAPVMKSMTGKTSSKDLTVQDYNVLCDWLQSQIPPE